MPAQLYRAFRSELTLAAISTGCCKWPEFLEPKINHPHNFCRADGGFEVQLVVDLTDGQPLADLGDGFVHMLESLGGKSGAGLLEQALGGSHLGVGRTLWFMVLSLAADFSAHFTESGFNLFHRPDAMTFVIVLGLGKRRVGVVQQSYGGGGLGLNMGDKTKGQKNGCEHGRATEEKIVFHGFKFVH
jgi:hypothetical protein